MSNLMYKVISSDIHGLELKLQRIKFNKMTLKFKKPVFFDKKALKSWKEEVNKLEREEENILKELQKNYNNIGDRIECK